jgi:hypothetical protein
MPFDVPTPRRPLPQRASAFTTSFVVGDTAGVLIAAAHRDGDLAGFELRVGKHGSTLAGMTDAIGAAASIALQHGAPLTEMTEQWRGTRYEPAGATNDPDIRNATSLTDYVARWLLAGFPAPDRTHSTAGSAPTQSTGPQATQ